MFGREHWDTPLGSSGLVGVAVFMWSGSLGCALGASDSCGVAEFFGVGSLCRWVH